MVRQFPLDLSKSRMIPSFVIPAVPCPPTGVQGLRPSKLARVSSARYYIAGESRLYQSTRLARRRPSSLPLRLRRHFRRAVPLGRCYGGDGYGVHSYPVEKHELLLPRPRLCPVRGQSGRTFVVVVVVGGKVCLLGPPRPRPLPPTNYRSLN